MCREMEDCKEEVEKSGSDCAEMLEMYNKKLVSYGLQQETRLFAHGQGYDLVERPAFFKGETMKVKENMFFAIHPEINTGKAFGNYCDQYLVTKDGAVRVETTPRQIYVI